MSDPLHCSRCGKTYYNDEGHEKEDCAPTKKFLSIDPGKKNTGYAWFDKEGIPIENKAISDQNKFMDWLEAEDVSACALIIIETYRNRGGRANDWSSNETSQIIGMIKRFAYKNNIKIVDRFVSINSLEDQMNLQYDGSNLYKIQQQLGDRKSEGREGTYSVDPYWLRKASNQKVYFWDYYTKSWILATIGDSFYLNDEGIPRKTGTYYGRPQ